MLGIHQNWHSRVWRRICHVVDDTIRDCRASCLDDSLGFRRHRCHLTNDPRSCINKPRHIYRLYHRRYCRLFVIDILFSITFFAIAVHSLEIFIEKQGKLYNKDHVVNHEAHNCGTYFVGRHFDDKQREFRRCRFWKKQHQYHNMCHHFRRCVFSENQSDVANLSFRRCRLADILNQHTSHYSFTCNEMF